MTLPPLNTPIAHDGSWRCPVDYETMVSVTYDWGGGREILAAYCFYWPDVTTYTIITRAPADRIKELEAALEADTALLYRAWLGLRVLKTVLTKAVGSDVTTPELLAAIEAAHPEFVPMSAMRTRAALKGATE
jgi:hypothetical protein